MNLERQSIDVSWSQADVNDLIVDAIRDIKGKNIAKLDLKHLDDAPAEYFIICEGDSTTQIRALADNVCKRVKEESGLTPNHVEGGSVSRWVLVDFFSTVVHIFHPEARSFYELEDLWNDAHMTLYESL